MTFEYSVLIHVVDNSMVYFLLLMLFVIYLSCLFSVYPPPRPPWFSFFVSLHKY